MTPAEFAEAQAALGLTNKAMAAALGVTERTVERYRAGDRKIPGPVKQILKIIGGKHE